MATAITERSGNGVVAPNQGGEKEMVFSPFGSRETIKLTIGIVRSMICVPTTSGKTCSDVDAMKFMMLCKARALNPFEGDAYMIGYDTQKGPSFSFITAHQALLKRAEVHAEYDGMESGVIVRDAAGAIIDREGDFIFDEDTILGGWATVHFKTRSHPMKKRVKFATFSTGQSRWKADPCGMICKVAEADALRSSFPSQLAGLYIEQEMDRGRQVEAISVRTEPPAELPTGRAKISRAKAPAPAPVPVPEMTPPPNNQTFAEGEIPNEDASQDNPDADTLPIIDPEEAKQGWLERIAAATKTTELDRLRGQLMQNRESVPDYEEIMDVWRRRYGELKK